MQELVFSTCTAWLKRQAARHGFDFSEDLLSVDAYTRHRGKKGDIKFSTVDFSGELLVTDAAALTAALAHGIGRAKAFGCGLLLVQRVL